MTLPPRPDILTAARAQLGFTRRTFRDWLERYSSVPADTFLPPEIASRAEFGDLLNARGLVGQAVEIGTHRGIFAEQLLSRWRGRLLTCVDPWTGKMAGSDNREADYQLARERLAQFGQRVELLRLTSDEACDRFSAGSLDFVYLDGDHHHEAVLADMENYWPLLAGGGVLAGHDLACSRTLRFKWAKGMLLAVGEFAEEHDLRVHLVPGAYWSWYVYRD